MYYRRAWGQVWKGETGNSIGFATDSLRITNYSRNRTMEE
jgi:antirestriction protein ArdC